MKTGAYIVLAAVILAGCSKPAAKDEGIRTISLAPSITEIICAVGGADTLVGRSSACNFPSNVVSKVPAIGGFGTPSIEVLLSLRPTVVFEVDMEDKGVTEKLKAMGIRLEHVKCDKIEEIPDAINHIGNLVGRSAEAKSLADSIAAGIEEFRSTAPSNRPAVFVEIWNDPLMTVGRSSFISQMVALAGGRNIGDELEKDYFQVSQEWVTSKDPDIIISLVMGDKKSVESRKIWADTKAVRSGRIYDNLNPDLCTRPGPRVLEGIRQMRECIEERKDGKTE